jgi:hypothetical protein
MVVPAAAVARSGIVALAVSLAAIIASPYVAYARLRSNQAANDWHYRDLAAEVKRLAGQPLGLVTGDEVLRGLPFYLPKTQPVTPAALSASEIKGKGLAVVCVLADMDCRRIGDTWADPASRSTEVTFKHRFLGFEGKPISYNITVIPPGAAGR